MTVALAAVSVATVANAATTDKKPAASKKVKSKGKTVANRKASAKVAAASSDEVASTKVRKVVTVKGKRRVIMVERGARPSRAPHRGGARRVQRSCRHPRRLAKRWVCVRRPMRWRCVPPSRW